MTDDVLNACNDIVRQYEAKLAEKERQIDVLNDERRNLTAQRDAAYELRNAFRDRYEEQKKQISALTAELDRLRERNIKLMAMLSSFCLWLQLGHTKTDCKSKPCAICGMIAEMNALTPQPPAASQEGDKR